MEERKVILQTIRAKEENSLDLAKKYYTILSVVNNIPLTEREIQVMSFLAVRGNILYSTNKQEFCDKYKSSPATIRNILSKLKKMGILVKDGKLKLNPAIQLDFSNNLVLHLKLLHG